MTRKNDTMSLIMQLNLTARPEFLAEFSNQQLGRYLQRLRDSRERGATPPGPSFSVDAPRFGWNAHRQPS